MKTLLTAAIVALSIATGWVVVEHPETVRVLTSQGGPR